MTESSKLEVALLALRDELHTRLKAIDHLLSPYSAAGAEIAPVKRAYKKREPKLAKGGGANSVPHQSPIPRIQDLCGATVQGAISRRSTRPGGITWPCALTATRNPNGW